MGIDDKLEKVLNEYQTEALITPGDRLLDAAINGIPFVGSSIAALFGGVARQRVQERTAEVFETMKEELDGIKEEAINKQFFETEEFQTLLALIIEQVQTTHDRE